MRLKITALSGALALAAAQGYNSVCSHDWEWNFGGWELVLAATCPDVTGRNHTSWIDIDDCVSNAEGVLVGRQSGRLSYSCRGCSLSRAGILACSCSISRGTYSPSSLDLNQIVKTENGILTCYNITGVEVKSLQSPPA